MFADTYCVPSTSIGPCSMQQNISQNSLSSCCVLLGCLCLGSLEPKIKWNDMNLRRSFSEMMWRRNCAASKWSDAGDPSLHGLDRR